MAWREASPTFASVPFYDDIALITRADLDNQTTIRSATVPSGTTGAWATVSWKEENSPEWFTVNFAATLSTGSTDPSQTDVSFLEMYESYAPVFTLSGKGTCPVDEDPHLITTVSVRYFHRQAPDSLPDPNLFNASYLATTPRSVDLQLRTSIFDAGNLGVTPAQKDGSPWPICVIYTAAISDLIAYGGGEPDHHATTIVHELGHTIGLTHRCAYFTHRTMRGTGESLGHGCAMAYSGQWLLTGGPHTQFLADHKEEASRDKVNKQLRMVRGTAFRRSADFCGRHIAIGRKIHMEDLLTVKWDL